MLTAQNIKKTLSISEAANYLQISASTIRRWDAQDKIKTQRTSGNHRRYLRTDLLRLKNAEKKQQTHYYSISKAAAKLKISIKTLRRWDSEGKIKSVRNQRNERLIAANEIERIKLARKAKIVTVIRNVANPGAVASGFDNSNLLAKFGSWLSFNSAAILVSGALLTLAIVWLGANLQKILTFQIAQIDGQNRTIADFFGKQKVLGGGTENLENVDDQNVELSDHYQLTAYGQNLLKNPSFETVKGQEPAFWQYHPNSTQNNTTISDLYPHSGSKTVLLHEGNYSLDPNSYTLGVIQESTKTEYGRSYELGVWIRNQGIASRVQGNPQLHLALGPGWDRAFDIDSGSGSGMTGGWKYYSTRFDNPPPNLVPRMYVTNLQPED